MVYACLETFTPDGWINVSIEMKEAALSTNEDFGDQFLPDVHGRGYPHKSCPHIIPFPHNHATISPREARKKVIQF